MLLSDSLVVVANDGYKLSMSDKHELKNLYVYATERRGKDKLSLIGKKLKMYSRHVLSIALKVNAI